MIIEIEVQWWISSAKWSWTWHFLLFGRNGNCL